MTEWAPALAIGIHRGDSPTSGTVATTVPAPIWVPNS